MRIYSKISPLFAAEGRNDHGNDRNKPEKCIYLFDKFEDAQEKAKELIHMCYTKVSVYRIS